MQGYNSILSAEESEFSFKKNGNYYSRDRNDKFEMSLTKMENFSFKKNDSPANTGIVDAQGSLQSVSKLSKTSLN